MILGFDDREERPEARLQRAFGIEPATAQQLISRLPATVQRAVSRVRAEYFRRALTRIGAHAEVRDENGAAVAPEHEPEPARAPPEAAASYGHAEPAQHSASMALDATGRALSPWRADSHAAVDPMSQTMAMAAPPAHVPRPAAPEPTVLDFDVRSVDPPAAALRGPARATVHEAPAPRDAHARAARPLAMATMLDARPPSHAPHTSNAPYAVTERPTTERAFAAVNPPVVSPGETPVWQPPAASAVGPAARPALAAPGTPTVGAAGWSNAAPPPAAAPAAVARAAVAEEDVAPIATPGWVANMPSGVFDPPRDDAPGHDHNGLPRIYAPRDPSSVFDPAPDGRSDAQRKALAAAALPIPPTAPPPDLGLASIERSAPGAAGGFDLDAALARKPAQGAQAPAFTLDPDPSTAALRVLSPWEQPNTRSMAEPPGRALARESAQSQRPPRARAGRSPAAEAGADPAAPRARAPRPAPRIDAAEGTPARRAPAAPTAEPHARGASDRRAIGASPENPDTRSFWETIGEAMALPFSGSGAYWIGAITAWSAAVAVLGFFANFAFPLGPFVMFFANTSVLAFAGDYYRVCLWAPATGEDVLDRAPDFDPVRLLNSYMKSGMHLTLFLIVSQVPLIAWLGTSVAEEGLEVLPELALHPLTWLLFLFPYFYWPMAVGLTALHNDFAAIWNVAAGLRAIGRAPAEYTLIVGIGMVTFVAAGIALFVFGSALGITGAVISGTLGFPLAVSHGIQGALMGHLLRARGEIFEHE